MLVCPVSNIASLFTVPSDSPPAMLLFSAGPVHFHYYSQSTNQRFHTHPAHLPALLPIVTLQDPPSGPPGTGPSPLIMATLSRTNQSQPASKLTPLQYVLTSSHSLAFLPSDLSLLPVLSLSLCSPSSNVSPPSTFPSCGSPV